MVLNKKIVRTMLENKSKYIASILLIILSTALYTSFSLAGPQGLGAIDDFREKYKVEDAEFLTGREIVNVKELEDKFDVVIEKRRVIDNVVFKGSTLRLLERPKKLNKYQITSGADIGGDNDIILNRDFAVKNNTVIGSLINVQGKSFRVKGYFAEPDYIYILKSETDIIPNLNKFGIGIISNKELYSFKNYSLVYSVSFKENNDKSFRKYVNENYIMLKWLNSEDNSRIRAVDGDMGGFFKVGEILPIIILIITSLLIAIVEWRIIKNEFNIIGTLYAVGYSKKKILVHYLSYAMFISVIASIIGQLPGIFLIKPLIATQAIQYNLPIININIRPGTIITSMLLPFIIIVPACIYVIMKALKLSPVQLMKGVLKEKKPSFLERKINLRRLSFNTRFKIRELVRNIPRTLLTLFSVMFASSLILFGFVTNDSMNWVFKNGYEETYKYNYLYSFNKIQFDKSLQGEKFWVRPFTAVGHSSKRLELKLQGMEKGAKLIELVDDDKTRLSFDKHIITVALAKKLGVNPGDTIQIKSRLDEKEIKIRIDAVAHNYIGDFIFIPMEEFYTMLSLPTGSFSGIASKKPLKIDSSLIMASMRKSDITGSFKEMTKPLKAVMGFISGASALIGLILIYIIISLIIEENRMNISLLKIMGYQKKRIYNLILNTNTLVVVAGYILSIPLVIAGMNSLFEEVTAKMDFSIPAHIDYINLVLGFVIVMATYEAAKLLTRRKVVNIPMTDALKAARE